MGRKHHFSSSLCLAAKKMDGSEEEGGGGGVIHNNNVREVERAESGVQGCGGKESKDRQTESEKQSGKIREAPVHC